MQVFMLATSVDPSYSNNMRPFHGMPDGLKMSLYTELCVHGLYKSGHEELALLFGPSCSSKSTDNKAWTEEALAEK